ncbi:cobalamin-binding protein [Marinobacter sp. chi1]|uniref:Cobalamin-binding protein n=1 Tax=Marinobacter suaedae TaxID=3057675 RepID=A0ABT8W048_9GAMM|nr:cobalamin-binding protein [Marinobacter sp. chi1]MDO3721556.1 cobalamin-binding protein [Marinobacter sp. chi1]
MTECLSRLPLTGTRQRLLMVLLATLFVGGPAAAALCETDDLNTRLCLDTPAQRVVSLSPGATEWLFTAGAGDQVVAVSAWSDYPEEAAKLPQVGDSNRLDLEAIVGLEPDLVVAWVDGNSREQLGRLSAIGIPVFWLAPRDFEDIAHTIERLARLTGHPETGEPLAEAFLSELATLRTTYAQRQPVRVFYQVWHAPLMTLNNDELISKAIALCGGVNVFGDLPRLVPRISTESVLSANPDAIITSGSPDQNQPWLDYWRQFPELAAVANGNLFLEPPTLLARPTLRLLEGTRHLCRSLEQARARL